MKDAERAEPTLRAVRRLNARAVKILEQAEQSGDHATALNAIREVRRGLELVARLTGELDPRSSESGNLQVIIQYADAPNRVAEPAATIVDAVALPEPE
jgi:hypothetical protein